VLWLQGGPGSSSMYGVFELHGPISIDYVDGGGEIEASEREFAWTRKANVLYVDNPLGTGARERASLY